MQFRRDVCMSEKAAALSTTAIRWPVTSRMASRARIAWTESETCFRILCERSLAGIYIVQDGCIKYANPAVAQILGREPQMLTGASPLAFVHPADRATVEEHMRRRLIGEEETSRYEARYVRADGDTVYVEVLGSRLDYGGRPALMGTMVDVTARKQAELAMEERLRFERLLADLSAGFVNLPYEQIELQIDGALKMLVEFLGNDRSTLFEFGEDPRHVLVTHSYTVPGCEPFPLGSFGVDRLPWYIGEFRSGRTVFLRSLPDDLPPEATQEKQHCLTHGIQSNVAIPLMVGGSVLGVITFAFLRQRCEWPAEIISRLRLIGEVFANALLRRRAEESLRAALDENQKLRQRLSRRTCIFASKPFCSITTGESSAGAMRSPECLPRRNGWPRPTRRSCCWAKRGPARNCSRRRSTS